MAWVGVVVVVCVMWSCRERVAVGWDKGSFVVSLWDDPLQTFDFES